MELIGGLLLVLVIIGHFVEGFALINFVQFFKGKKTSLEKISEKYQASKHNKFVNKDKF
ncbi:hypothetical protein ACMAZF_07460 [Psychrobium sp. nBUS_13]|uniref:hypothetical protein n=1 Tax=Psychrobium sp. nBUS_13 TaxID=3395319 RepID=UPI003EB9AA30